MRNTKLIFILALCMLAAACTQKEGNGLTKLLFTQGTYSMEEGDEVVPELRLVENSKYNPYNPAANPKGLVFTSSDESIFTVSPQCVITAVSAGEATLTASGSGLSAKTKVSVSAKGYHLPDIHAPFTPSMIFGQFAMKNSANQSLNPQSFDIDSNGKIWLEGARKPFVHVIRFSQAGKVDPATGALNGCAADAGMEIFYAGHGTCLCVEPGTDAKNQHFWFANFGTKQADGSYLKPKILSRTLYVPGKRILPQEADEHFYFGEEYIQMLPCIDFESGILAIWVSSKATVTMFRLEDVLAAPVKDMEIGGMVWGGETESPSKYATEGTVSVSIKAHDCRNLTPVAKFKMTVSGGTQGYCVYGSDHRSYHLVGASTPVNTRLTVYDGQGNAIIPSEGFGFDDDISKLIENGLTTKEYLESEGIRIRDKKMYICVASTIGSNRVTTILQFL